jgi:carboxypeptidase Q
VFELTGTELPHEVVLISGHFDSWDVGQGAMDDGGGCATMWAALSALKMLGG